MYKLTLTADERKAIDWVGGRYRHGDELSNLLWCESTYPDDVEWADDVDVTFLVPEHVAHQIGDIVQEGLDCFGSELCEKLVRFWENLV